MIFGMFPRQGLLGEASMFHVATCIREDSPDCSRDGEPCHISTCDSEGSASEEKVIFVLKLLGPILPVGFH